MDKKQLFTPGPTEVPQETLLESAKPVIHHRKQVFKELFRETTENLKYVFASEKSDVHILSSTGTGAMEAAVLNFTSPGDSAAVIVSGKFGERWRDLCKSFDVNAEIIEYEWGDYCKPDDVRKVIKEKNIKAVFATLVETSTGTVNPIRELAEVTSQAGVLLVVDAVSGLGCDRLEMDKWDVDVVVSGSQKALMTPPGLGFVCVNSKAKDALQENKRKNYYWNLKKSQKSLGKMQTPYTSPVNLIKGLNNSLKMIISEGMEAVWGRHQKLSGGAQAGIEEMGLEIFSKSPAAGLTAVKIPSPDKIGESFTKHCEKKYGVVLAGGQAHLKGKIFRIAHMGYYDEMDVVKSLAAIEATLNDLGERNVLGCGVKAALEKFSGR